MSFTLEGVGFTHANGHRALAGVDLRAAAQTAADFLDPNSPPLVSVSVVLQCTHPGALGEV